MRIALPLSLVLALAVEAGAQARPAPPAQQPQTQGTSQAKPAQPQTAKPAPPARRPATARGGMAITVTDSMGMPLSGIQVSATGPTDRTAETDADGRVNLPSLLGGAYRLTFTGAETITFEREVTLRAGQVANIDVTLKPAPPPPAPPPPPPPPPPATPEASTGPRGEPLTLGIVEFLEKEFVGREARRESLLSCSGNERTTMIQLNEALPGRLYDGADAVYYVLAGEGSVTLDGRTVRLATNGFVSAPRGTLHSFDRRGNRPFVLLAVLSGEPCEQSK